MVVDVGIGLLDREPHAPHQLWIGAVYRGGVPMLTGHVTTLPQVDIHLWQLRYTSVDIHPLAREI